MSVVFDASVLVDLFNERLVGDRRARIDHLVATLSKQKTRVLIPAPALTEFPVKAGKARERYVRELQGSASFRIEPFDQKAALECALLLDEAWTRGHQRKVTHTKFKFDWQIVAIAASRNANAIYSDDADIARAAARANIAVFSTDSLALPDSARQEPLRFDAPKD
jgi:predicted nucleic acid-binding protein